MHGYYAFRRPEVAGLSGGVLAIIIAWTLIWVVPMPTGPALGLEHASIAPPSHATLLETWAGITPERRLEAD